VKKGFAHGVDPRHYIIVRGARQHNLKNVDLNLPKHRINVITGPSGSGKSSLAFNTIFAEGQRRYMESLSAYARQFLVRMDKPDVDYLGGLAPAIAIEQKTIAKNPRSTVATQTEIYDHLRLLYARVGTTISPISGEPVTRDTPQSAAAALTKEWDEGTRFYLAFSLHDAINTPSMLERGFSRILLLAPDGDAPTVVSLNDIRQEVLPKGTLVLLDRLIIRKNDEINITRISDSVEHAFKENKGRCVAIPAQKHGTAYEFSEHFERDGLSFEEPTVHLFSFNSPVGACPRCQGSGLMKGFDPRLVIPDVDRTLRQGAIACFHGEHARRQHLEALLVACSQKGIDIDCPYRLLPKEHRDLIWKGFGPFIGIANFLNSLRELRDDSFYSPFTTLMACEDCGGTRLRRDARYVQIGGLHLGQIMEFSAEDAQKFFDKLELPSYKEAVAKILLEEIRNRLRFLVEVGLGYVTLHRPSRTLSGGESQRINLAASLGSALVGSLYVLDEPTIGLHPRDTTRLINILKRLRDLGNTVLVVEHDADVMRQADEIIDLGPGAGLRGGTITFQGGYEAILKSNPSLTGAYLSQRKNLPIPKKRRKPNWSQALIIEEARANNLKRITARFPFHLVTVVTGVSGSGKSTLIHDTLYLGLRRLHSLSTGHNVPGAYKAMTGHLKIDEVLMVDQSPIGRSSRSNPATYIGAFDGIRQLFSSTDQALMLGYTPGYFSFNVEGGRCPACDGEGTITIEMQFLADLHLECEDCGGKRFKEGILEIYYRGKNIDDVLNLTVDEAIKFFADSRPVIRRLNALRQIGLGYLKLGQPANTLSGGEAQRVKLAKHLDTPQKQHSLYLFDEPTTGLHFDDIRRLLFAFNRLVEKGHTVIVIEHNMDLIRAADWVIDLGPEGGFRGGYIVTEGAPETVAEHETSHTARYLREALA